MIPSHIRDMCEYSYSLFSARIVYGGITDDKSTAVPVYVPV